MKITKEMMQLAESIHQDKKEYINMMWPHVKERGSWLERNLTDGPRQLKFDGIEAVWYINKLAELEMRIKQLEDGKSN